MSRADAPDAGVQGTSNLEAGDSYAGVPDAGTPIRALPDAGGRGSGETTSSV